MATDRSLPDEPSSKTLGARVRSLRRSAGMTQAELADGRFSKEYVSQIERGKTRPPRETVDWLADRLATDTAQLALGRALTGQERLSEAESWTAAAETTFEQANLVSHRSYAWLAQGDIESRRGNDRAAARLFRSSALALLDDDVAPG